MEDKIAVIGNGGSYAKEIAAVLSDSVIVYHDMHLRRDRKNFTLRGNHKETHPWDKIHLSKAARKGKTYEQMQELRARKWERQCNKRLQQDKNPPREVMAVKLI
jgi:hypothetical protein